MTKNTLLKTNSYPAQTDTMKALLGVFCTKNVNKVSVYKNIYSVDIPAVIP